MFSCRITFASRFCIYLTINDLVEKDIINSWEQTFNPENLMIVAAGNSPKFRRCIIGQGNFQCRPINGKNTVSKPVFGTVKVCINHFNLFIKKFFEKIRQNSFSGFWNSLSWNIRKINVRKLALKIRQFNIHGTFFWMDEISNYLFQCQFTISYKRIGTSKSFKKFIGVNLFM